MFKFDILTWTQNINWKWMLTEFGNNLYKFGIFSVYTMVIVVIMVCLFHSERFFYLNSLYAQKMMS